MTLSNIVRLFDGVNSSVAAVDLSISSVSHHSRFACARNKEDTTDRPARLGFRCELLGEFWGSGCGSGSVEYLGVVCDLLLLLLYSRYRSSKVLET